MARSGWRGHLYKWHRRVGVVLGVFWCWMALSGFVIHHAHDFGWDRQAVISPLILSWYGLEHPPVLHAGDQALTLNDHGLLLGNTPLGDCSRLLGLAPVAQGFVLACPEQVVLLDAKGELIDRIDAARGLAHRPDRLGTAGPNAVIADSAGGLWKLDADTMVLNSMTNATPAWLVPISPVREVTREQFLLDLHALRFGGPAAAFLLDFLAAVTLALAGSGWVLARKKRYKLHRS